MTPEIALALWRRALTEEFGLAIPLLNPSTAMLRKAQKIMYDARKQAKDPELERLMLVLPNGGKEFWLVKKEVELDQ